MKYDIKENNHPGWLNKGPWYNISKMLGLNPFIKIKKLYKKEAHEAMKKLFRQIPSLKSIPLSHDKRDQFLLIDISCAYLLIHWAACDCFLGIRKQKYFFE